MDAPRTISQGRVVTVAASIILIATLTAGVLVNARTNELSAENRQMVARSSAGLAGLASVSESLATEAKAAERAVSSADGKVLDPAVLSAIAARVTAGRKTKLRLDAGIAAATRKVRANTIVGSYYPWDFEIAKEAFDRVDLSSDRTAAAAARAQMELDVIAVQNAVTAWETEQARVAAAKAEAERVARDAAEQAAEQAAAAVARSSAAARSGAAAVSPIPRASAGVPAAPTDKLAVAQATFARFGFSKVVYNGGQSQGHYAGTDMDNQIIYVQLTLIPSDRVASACIHEFMHILQARTYGGYAQTVAHFGSVLGMEQNADRMAVANGATWTHYI